MTLPQCFYSKKTSFIVFMLLLSSIVFGVDNASLYNKSLGKHYKTYGLVYIVPQKAMDKIETLSNGMLREKLVNFKIFDALNRTNIPHITVLHIHTQDTTLPEKMLQSMPKLPKPFSLNLKGFALIKASKNSTMPWWFDIGVEHSLGYQNIMEFNELATKTLTPLRDSPLPRVSGNIYMDLPKQAQEQIKDLGVNGLNRTINGKKEWLHRPHITLSYSMQMLDSSLETELKNLADELNKILSKGVRAEFENISIVELGITGNVLREIYRINLNNGKVTNISTSLQN